MPEMLVPGNQIFKNRNRYPIFSVLCKDFFSGFACRNLETEIWVTVYRIFLCRILHAKFVCADFCSVKILGCRKQHDAEDFCTKKNTKILPAEICTKNTGLILTCRFLYTKFWQLRVPNSVFKNLATNYKNLRY